MRVSHLLETYHSLQHQYIEAIGSLPHALRKLYGVAKSQTAVELSLIRWQASKVGVEVSGQTVVPISVVTSAIK